MKLVCLLAVVVLLFACVSRDKEELALHQHQINQSEEPEAPVVQANPASEYCVQQGGEIKIVQGEEEGELGLCHLPDGQVVEEWVFYRMYLEAQKN